MGLFKKKGNDNTEIVEGLKSLIERANDFLTSIGIDEEKKALFTQPTDVFKAEVEKVLGIPIDDFMLGIKNNEFLISYWLPLAAATIFLGTTDVNKLQKDNELPAILNNPLPELADWEEVFNNLLLLPSSVLNFYIARMDCSYKAKKTIMDALLKPDFASFEKCIENMGSESDLLKNVADWYKVLWGFYSVFTEGVDNKNQEIMANNSSSSMEEEEGDSCRTTKDLAASLSVSEKEGTPEIISKINYENMKSIYLLNMNLYLKSRADYLKERDSYSKEIQDIVDPYVVDPEEIDFYVELKKRGCTFDAIEDNGTEKVSFDDLVIFDNNPGSRKDEYFEGLDSQIVSEGDERFKEFVNYIADSGCIDRSSKAKQLFTYRLTGRCRPNKDKLPKLKWCGLKNNSPNELIYVIKYATLRTGTKYPRMKEFFEGPNFPKNSCASYADQAGLDFRYKLNEFYPGVFKLKK